METLGIRGNNDNDLHMMKIMMIAIMTTTGKSVRRSGCERSSVRRDGTRGGKEGWKE